MAKDKLTDYSATNASNTDIGGINIDEGMLPSAVNNALREQMTHLKNFSDGTDAIDALTVTGDLTVDTNTLVVDAANNNVGIGTTSPAAGLDVRSGLTGNGQFLVDGSTTGGAGAGGAFLKFMGSNGTAAQIAGIDGSMVDGSAGAESGIIAFHTMSSGTSSEKMRILAGGGLTFNGDTAAANALDDYEEGTWTPSSGVGSAPTNSGHYTKIGRLVTVYGDCTFTGSGSVSASVSGLPFTIASPQTGGAVGFNNIASGVMLIASTGGNLVLYNGLNVTVNIPNNGRILFCISYQTS